MTLFLSRTATKQLPKLPLFIRSKIENKIESLAKNPHPPKSIKLTGRPAWRLRVGDYRILYTINKRQKTITILSIAHRKHAYK